jgi:hypothetical protein
VEVDNDLVRLRPRFTGADHPQGGSKCLKHTLTRGCPALMRRRFGSACAARGGVAGPRQHIAIAAASGEGADQSRLDVVERAALDDAQEAADRRLAVAGVYRVGSDSAGGAGRAAASALA